MEHFTHPLRRSDLAAIHRKLPEIYHGLGATISPDDMGVALRHLGLMRRKNADLQHEFEVTALFDYVRYSFRRRGFNTVELYLRTCRQRLDELSLALLERMSRAMYTLYRVDSIKKECVQITDLLLGTSSLLIEYTPPQRIPGIGITYGALSKSPVPGVSFGAHLLTLDGCVIHSGIALPLDPERLFRARSVNDALAALRTESAKRDPVLRAKLARATIATVLNYSNPNRAYRRSLH